MADETKIIGPYRFRSKWRCQIVVNGRREWTPLGRTPEHAERLAQRCIEKVISLRPLSIGDAIERYGEHLRTKENKPASYEGTPMRLRYFFRPVLAQPLVSLTPHRCGSLYRELTTRKSERTGKPLAVDTHRAYLADAKSFTRWALKSRLLQHDPLAAIEGIGRRRHDKPQLRIDEAKRWLAKAQELAGKGTAGAVAAMVALLMGLRASEIVSRVVRDPDDGGRLLWIPDSKTEAGRRTVKVPELLQPYLLKLSRDKLPTAYLFPGKTGGQPDRALPCKWVQRICKLVKVPAVCAHSMRGLHATLAIEAGASPDLVARSLGHEHAGITLQSYAEPGSAQAAAQQAALRALTGKAG